MISLCALVLDGTSERQVISVLAFCGVLKMGSSSAFFTLFSRCMHFSVHSTSHGSLYLPSSP